MPGEKGSYRSVYSAIWDDPEFQSFPPTTQLVFLHLRTCPECNWPCIFPFYTSLLGERLNTIKTSDLSKAWDTLCHPPSHPSSPWLIYERPLLWIVKGMKNEPSYSAANPNHAAGVISILKTLPKLEIINKFTDYYGLNFNVDLNSAHSPHPMGDATPHAIPHPMGDQGTGTGTGTGTGKYFVTRTGGNGRFTPPTLEEVSEHVKNRGNRIDPIKFHAHYTSNGWKVGKNSMKSWRAAIVTWERSAKQ